MIAASAVDFAVLVIQELLRKWKDQTGVGETR